MTVEIALLQLLTGLSAGMVLFLIAAGMSIIFGTLRIINLAHGSIYMLGTFLCFWFTSRFTHIPGVYWWALLFAPLGIALLGGLIEIFLLRLIYGEHELYTFILTFGLILVLGDVCKLIWGVAYHTVSAPWPINGVLPILGMSFPVHGLFLIGCGIAIFIGLTALMRYTGLGRTIRAVTYNREVANSLGINAPRVYTGVFMLGCWLAGLAGILMPPMSVVGLGTDMAVIIDCFIIVVIGGLGSLTGAFIGAIILGLLNSFGILAIPRMAVAFGFILMIIILVIRPRGLMGRPE